jgi:hypothetical protein
MAFESYRAIGCGQGGLKVAHAAAERRSSTRLTVVAGGKSVDGHDDLLEKGFELAYFIVPDRSVAIDILIGAMNKLETQCGQEKKRTYWRDKNLKRWITRVTRDDGDTLQWLIYFESECHEKRQEASGQCTFKDLVVHYIKSLVRMTTAMSSFHVNIGLHRFLHNYSTSEAQHVYELLTERYLGADEYRRAKSMLMSKLEDRFSKYLQTVKTNHGEVRFEACQDQRRWTNLVEECLTTFTPWSTKGNCLVPASFGPDSGNLSHLLSGKGHENVKQDKIEINRCHALIDPTCYSRLIKALGFDSPEERLALPRFLMDSNDKTENQSGHPPQTPRLTKQERETIKDNISAEVARRQTASPAFLRILVDRTECARVDLEQEAEVRFEIPEGSELLEIWTEDRGRDLLLATQLIGYTEGQGITPVTSTISLKGRKKLVLDISPTSAAPNEVRQALVSLNYFSDSRDLALGVTWQRFLQWFGPMPRYALAAIALFVLGGALGASMYHRELSSERIALERVNQELARERAMRASLPTKQTQNVAETTTGSNPAYRLLSDDSMVRGPGGPEQPTVLLSDRSALVNLELPTGTEGRRLYRAVLKPFLEEKEILIENLLQAQNTAKGPTVLFSVPALLLVHNKDYVVDLRYITSKGALAELNTFTFHVVKKKN